MIVTLIGKPGCHLCDEARAVVMSVCADTGTAWREVSILDDEQLSARYWQQIPVVQVDDRDIAFWHVTAEQLRAALSA